MAERYHTLEKDKNNSSEMNNLERFLVENWGGKLAKEIPKRVIKKANSYPLPKFMYK